jgi:hypothetical protein
VGKHSIRAGKVFFTAGRPILQSTLGNIQIQICYIGTQSKLPTSRVTNEKAFLEADRNFLIQFVKEEDEHLVGWLAELKVGHF